MKRFFLGVTAIAAMLSLSGCEYMDELLQLAEDAQTIVNGNILTYGNHTYSIVSDINVHTTEFNRATASVTFTNIPVSYAEFEVVYNNLLGKSIAGTAAMIPMAMEIYARDASTGEKCIKLLCSSGVATEIITELKRKVVSSSASGSDGYFQRYIPAALLKGAMPSNAYTPSSPYTVEMTMTSNGVKTSAQAGGTVTYMCIVTSGGWSTAQRGVDIFLANGASQYKVYGCAGCYSQCASISGTWSGLK